jgi:hypothetical protein
MYEIAGAFNWSLNDLRAEVSAGVLKQVDRGLWGLPGWPATSRCRSDRAMSAWFLLHSGRTAPPLSV